MQETRPMQDTKAYYGSGQTRDMPGPAEPALMAKSEELLKHISNLEQEHGRLRSMLFGPVPESGQANCKASVSSVADMISLACHRVACLVGDAATLNGKVG